MLTDLLNAAISTYQAGDWGQTVALCHQVTAQFGNHPLALHLLGLSSAQQGDVASALLWLRQACQADPENADFWRTLALVAQEAGDSGTACDAWASYLHRMPQDGAGWNEYGALLSSIDRLSDAIAAFRHAVAADPNAALAHANLGLMLERAQDFAGAEAALSQALTLQTDFPEALLALGSVYQQQGHDAKAVACFRQAARLRPDDDLAPSRLGLLLLAQGTIAEAIPHLADACQRQPAAQHFVNHSLALISLAKAQEDETPYIAALDSAGQALALAPDFDAAAEAWRNALVGLGRTDDALAHLLTQPRPDDPRFLFQRADIQLQRDAVDAAIADLQAALALAPTDPRLLAALGALAIRIGLAVKQDIWLQTGIDLLTPLADDTAASCEIWLNMAIALANLERPTEALAACERILALNPDHMAALANQGAILMSLARFPAAETCFQQVLRIKPHFPKAHNNIAICRANSGDIDGALTALRQAIAQDPDYLSAHSNLLFYSHFSAQGSLEDLWQQAQSWCQRFAPAGAARPAIRGDADKQLRVGFVSADLRNHVVAQFFEPVLRHRDARQWRAILYSDAARPDAVSHRLAAQADQWHDIAAWSDEALINQIRADGIDILFDLSGHTAGSRLAIFAHRPAPIQASWLGYFDTTGLGTMDYLLADPVCVPPDLERYFSEIILRLPDDFVCYQPPATAPAVGPLPALTRGHITFGSANQLAKLTDPVINTWSSLLHDNPDARLALLANGFRDDRVRDAIARRFAAAGAPVDRLDLEHVSGPDGVLRWYNERIDIALDPFPCVGGTTTCEALWMGVPVVTLLGERFCSRHSASHLTAAGLPAGIATTLPDYLARATAWAGDTSCLSAMRAALRPRMAASPLTDGARFTRHFETLLRRMWQEQHAAMIPPVTPMC